ncbi:unnamed protein product, partial [Discosporangium mesarthrocarpum]
SRSERRCIPVDGDAHIENTAERKNTLWMCPTPSAETPVSSNDAELKREESHKSTGGCNGFNTGRNDDLFTFTSRTCSEFSERADSCVGNVQYAMAVSNEDVHTVFDAMHHSHGLPQSDGGSCAPSGGTVCTGHNTSTTTSLGHGHTGHRSPLYDLVSRLSMELHRETHAPRAPQGGSFCTTGRSSRLPLHRLREIARSAASPSGEDHIQRRIRTLMLMLCEANITGSELIPGGQSAPSTVRFHQPSSAGEDMGATSLRAAEVQIPNSAAERKMANNSAGRGNRRTSRRT